MSQEQYTENLKVIVAEQLRGVHNFTEDVNYVAEYIVLLIVNGGDVESIVKELSTLFDAIPVDVLKDIVQTDFFALEALQQGETVDSIVSKIRELNGNNQQQQQQQISQQQQQQMPQELQQQQMPQQQAMPQQIPQQQQQQQQQQIPQQMPQQQAMPQQPSIPQGPSQSGPEQTRPVSAFSGVVDTTSSVKAEDDVSMGNDITVTDYKPRFSNARGGIQRNRRGRGGASVRGNSTSGPGGRGANGSDRFNPLAKALGMDARATERGAYESNLNFVPKRKEGRCKLFPHCPLGKACPHAHPTKVCNDYPNCPKPPGTCEYLHPNEDEELMKDMERTREEFQKRKAALLEARQKPVQTGLVICKFGILCSNPLCPFGHPTPANEDAKVIDMVWCPSNLTCQDPECRKAHSSLSKIKQVEPMGRPKPPAPKPMEKSLEQCKYGIRCTNKRCKYRHAKSPTMCRDGANCTRIDCIFGHPINEDCRFGIECRNPTCLFRHPPGRIVPSKGDQGTEQPANASFPNATTGILQAVPTNQRIFAMPEGSRIEQAPAQEQTPYQPPFPAQNQGQGDMEMN